jgi:transcriptional regulator with XRE-family HTH domain
MGKINHYRDEDAITGFGKKVRTLRMERNMTIEEFANSVDLHVTQLSRIERGETNVTISYIFRLAEIFNVRASELLDFDK